jgi:hypothetical protein
MPDTTVEIDPCNSGNHTTERPTLRAVGPDADIYIDIIAKGTGAIVFRGHGGGAHAGYFYAEHADGLNFPGLHGSRTDAKLRAIGPGTNVSLLLEPQRAGTVKVKNGIQLMEVQPDGTQVNAGFLALHKHIFGGTSMDTVFRAEPGNAIRFFVGGQEAFRMESDGGIVIGNPTGGSKGPGTINAQAIYKNGVLV